MDLTSKAKWDQMGVSEPIYGYVFDYMLVNDRGVLPFSDLIHPKVETEIAFLLGEDIEGPGISVRVLVTELKKTNWGIAGVPASERK